MALEYVKQIENIATVGELIAELAQHPLEMKIGDSFGEPLLLSLCRDLESGDLELEMS